MTCNLRQVILAWVRCRLAKCTTRAEDTDRQQVTLADTGLQLAIRGIGPEDIAREAYNRFYINYPHSTVSAFLGGYLNRGTLAYKVIRLTILEAYGLEIVFDHGTSLQPGEPATQGKEL